MPEYETKVSIIIPHWNGIDTLSECLQSLSQTNFQFYEIIVVDNASSDGSQEWIKKTYPDIGLIENTRNLGYAGGCNLGANNAKGSLIVFLNNDTIQDKDWLNSLVAIMDENKKIAAVQPKILNYYDKTIFDYAGGSGGYMDIFCFPYARGRLFSNQEIDSGQYDDRRQCFWASGTALMVRKELFFRAGEFDEKFFAHMEEIDLCWRLQAMGYQIWVEPRSIVYHKNAISLPMQTHKKYYLNHRNSLLMLFGNYSFLNAFYLGIMRIIFELIALLYAVIKFDWNHVTGIIRALVWIFLHPFTIIKKRSRFKFIRIDTDKKIMKNIYKKSVVISHYLKGEKTYLEIDSKAS